MDTKNLSIFKKKFCAVKRKAEDRYSFVYFAYVTDFDETHIFLEDLKGKNCFFPISEIVSIEEVEPKYGRDE